jgi:hypothetical protein
MEEEKRRTMHRQHMLRVAFVGVLSAAIAAGACQRTPEPEGEPATELQSEALYRTDRPITVAGCLRAGEAANTFVLTSARADGMAETRTYQLITVQELDLRDELRDHVGQMVQVDGTLRARQAATAQTVAEPAEAGNDRPTGTVGEPMVQTRTDVQIDNITVESVKPLGEACGI